MRDIKNLFIVVHSDVWAWPMEEIVIINSMQAEATFHAAATMQAQATD